MSEIYKVQPEDLIGEIDGFPIEVVQLMVQRQFEYLGVCNVSVFQRRATAGANGFVWSGTVEGREFWSPVIEYRDFARFFDRYGGDMPKLKTAKPARKNKGIAWTKPQRWIIERLPNNGVSFPSRIEDVANSYEVSMLIKRGFALPLVAEELNEALEIFGCAEISGDLSQKLGALTSYIRSEACSIHELWKCATVAGHRINSLDISCRFISRRSELERFAINWLRKNLAIAKHSNTIYFVAENMYTSINRRGMIGSIPLGYKREGGIYRNDSNIIIGNVLYRINN